MLKNIAAALLATSLIAAPALAAQPSGGTDTAPAATAAPGKQATAIKSVKNVKHARKTTHRHVARAHGRTMKVARHGKLSHKQAAHVAKPISGKSDRSGKTDKSST